MGMVTATATAQVPGLPSLTGEAKPPPKTAAAPESPEQAKARIAKQLNAAREEAEAEKDLVKLAERKLETALKALRLRADDVERVRLTERERAARIEKEQAAAVQRAIQVTRRPGPRQNAVRNKSSGDLPLPGMRIRAIDALSCVVYFFRFSSGGTEITRISASS